MYPCVVKWNSILLESRANIRIIFRVWGDGFFDGAENVRQSIVSMLPDLGHNVIHSRFDFS
jgi:hypothetical protein